MLLFKGLPRTSSQPHDYLYELRNRKLLGISEVQLVQNMYDGIKELIALETRV